MTELDKLAKTAFGSKGAQQDVNKFYSVFFRTRMFMPAYQQDSEEEPFTPLFLQEDEKFFISIFDSLSRLSTWAGDKYDGLDYVEIDGSDVIRCIGTDFVYLSLNPGLDYYKEFSPDEIQRLKLMLAKIDSLKDMGNEA